MVKKAIIIAADDPTATSRSGTDTSYDLNSGVLIKYADPAGAIIAAELVLHDPLFLMCIYL